MNNIGHLDNFSFCRPKPSGGKCGKKKKSLSLALVDEVGKKVMKKRNVPKRQYYHSRTNVPMKENAWVYDSDDQSDDDWLHENSKEVRILFAMVNDFQSIYYFFI